MTLMVAESDTADLAEVRRFLLGGFGEGPEFVAFLPEVLRWKYFCTGDGFSEAKSFIARDDRQIVAHIGLCYRDFIVGPDLKTYRAAHPIDWYSSPKHPGAGASLMLKVFQLTKIQYVIGGTAIAKRAHKLLGYQLVTPVTVYRKFLRPGYPLRREEGRLARRSARSLRNAALVLRHLGKRSRIEIDLKEVKSFDSAVDRFSLVHDSTVVSGRNSQLLNHFLNFPGGGFSGYLIQHQHTCIGIAVLHKRLAGKVMHGSIVECRLDTDDADCWCSVYRALAKQLRSHQVDVIATYSSTENSGRQLVSAGFHPYRKTDVFLRDRDGLLGHRSPLQLSKLDADHGF